MPHAATNGPSNRLLERLPQRSRDRLLARCQVTELAAGIHLCETDDAYRNVYFPLSCIISMTAGVEGHPPLQMFLVGDEGMVGMTLLLGVATAPMAATVLGPGSAWRISAAQFRSELRDNSSLRRGIGQYLFESLSQLAQTASCLRFHEVEARLARWLIGAHDRAHADHFHITHHLLADLLGVQRAAITIAAGGLQRRGLISYSRGEIRIVSRPGLQAAACHCQAAGWRQQP